MTLSVCEHEVCPHAEGFHDMMALYESMFGEFKIPDYDSEVDG